jgi:hypothetical protein
MPFPPAIAGRKPVCLHSHTSVLSIDFVDAFVDLAPLRHPRDSYYWHHLVTMSPFKVRCRSCSIPDIQINNTQLDTRKAQVSHPTRQVLWVILRSSIE